MNPRNSLRRQIESLVEARRKTWESQGRSERHRQGVTNFWTGQGVFLILDLVDLVRKERMEGEKELLRLREEVRLLKADLKQERDDYQNLWQKYLDMHN